MGPMEWVMVAYGAAFTLVIAWVGLPLLTGRADEHLPMEFPAGPRRYLTGFARCETCLDRVLCLPSDACLVDAEVAHAIAGCKGALRLEEPTLAEMQPPRAGAAEVCPIRPRPTPAPGPGMRGSR
jgi:hypothetical protein